MKTTLSTLTPEKAVLIAREVLNQLDPERLIATANLDEYDAEAIQIAAFVFSFRSNIETHSVLLKKQINRVWNLYFDHDCKEAEKATVELIAAVINTRMTRVLPNAPMDEKDAGAFADSFANHQKNVLRFFGLE